MNEIRPLWSYLDAGGIIKDPVHLAAISLMSDITLTQAATRARLELLFNQARSTSIAALIGAVICCAYFYSTSPGKGPIIWLVAALLAGGLRLLLYRWFFTTDRENRTEDPWLHRHGLTAIAIGLVWGAIPLLPIDHAPAHVREIQTLAPGFILMAAIVSYGVYLSQYMVLLVTMSITVIATRLWVSGLDGLPTVLLFALCMPVLTITAKRHALLIKTKLSNQSRMKDLVDELTATNGELQQHNRTLAEQQDLIDQEEALAQHVFKQLTLGGDHTLPGIHTWNQPMGRLSGDLTQTARGPAGEAYIFLGDFTGHGLPAALAALPASSIFLAMAPKGLSLELMVTELNVKLSALLPVGYFCCAALIRLSADRRTIDIWNGGLPPVVIQHPREGKNERIASHSLPLGVTDGDAFDPSTHQFALQPGDLLYAYTDGLTEAENCEGEMWGQPRLEAFLQREDLVAPRLPALIDTVLDHVNLAPASDDISVIEIIAVETDKREANNTNAADDGEADAA